MINYTPFSSDSKLNGLFKYSENMWVTGGDVLMNRHIIDKDSVIIDIPVLSVISEALLIDLVNDLFQASKRVLVRSTYQTLIKLSHRTNHWGILKVGHSLSKYLFWSNCPNPKINPTIINVTRDTTFRSYLPCINNILVAVGVSVETMEDISNDRLLISIKEAIRHKLCSDNHGSKVLAFITHFQDSLRENVSPMYDDESGYNEYIEKYSAPIILNPNL